MDFRTPLVSLIGEKGLEDTLETFNDVERPTLMLQTVHKQMRGDSKAFHLFVNHVMTQMASRLTCPLCKQIVIGDKSQVVLECGHWCCNECMSKYEEVHAAKLKRLNKAQKPPVCWACRAKRNSCSRCKRKGVTKIY